MRKRLVFYKKNEGMLCDQIAVLKRDASFNESEINALKIQIERLKKEKESNQFKIDNFENASKSLDKLIGSQISDNNRKGVGYNAVAPPPTGLFAPPTIDLSSSGLEEFQQPEFEGYGLRANKSVCENSSNETKKNSNAPLIEEWVSDNEDEVKSPVVVEKKTVIPTIPKVDVVRPKQQEKPVRKTVRSGLISLNTARQSHFNAVRWSQVSLIMRTKPGVDSLSFDDLYNNLRVFENDVKGSTASSSSTQNVAFVSENTSSTNDVSTAYGVSNPSGHNSQYEQTSSYSLLANQSSCPQLDHEDLEQLDEFDLEEMDLKWQVAMISMRMKKFYKKTGRKLQFDAKEPVDSKRRDAWNSRNKDGRRSGKQEDSKALVTINGECVDWTSYSEEEEDNALMACNSLGSDIEVTSYSKECKESYAKLKKLYDEQRAQLSNASIEIQAYTLALKKVEAQLVAHQQGQRCIEEKIRFMKIDLDDKTDVLTYHKKLLAEAEKEKEDLKAKVEKWHNSSKNLGKLLNTQMSANDKFGLGYGDYRYDGILSYENEVLQSVFMNKESDLENQPLYDSDETHESLPEPAVNEPKVVSQPKVWSDAPIIEEYESDSEDEHVSLPTEEQETPSFANQQVKTPRETVKNQFTHSKNPKVDKKGLGYEFVTKACFVCGSLSHLIRDCDFHEKRMAKQAELNNRMRKMYSQREIRTIWNNVQRVNHKNQFVPRAVLTRTGKILVNTARASGTNNVSTARHNFKSQAVLTNAARKISTVKPFVNRLVLLGKKETAVKPSAGCNWRPKRYTVISHQNFTEQSERKPCNEVYLQALFLNDHTCVACQKGKQHKASCKAKSESSISQPLQLLHMDLFGPTTVDFEKEAEFLRTLFLPIWSSYSSTVKRSTSKDAGEAPNKHHDLKTDDKPVDKEDQVFLEELERLKRQEHDAYDAAEALRKKFAKDTEDLLFQAEAAKAMHPIPTSRINSIHPSTLILGDPQSAVQTRSKVTKNSKAHAFVSYIQKQRINNHKDFQHCLFAYFLSQNEPKKTSEALADESWVDAMQEELLQFKIQKVWILVDLPYGKKAIGTKWVYRNKKDERGVVVRNKARLVPGHMQEEGIDYDEVFAPMAWIEAIRIFLAFASYMGFIVYQMDMKSAFLYRKIDEEVYVSQPPGFIDPKYPKKVYKVVKVLYGLHQAPRVWYATLSTFLLKNGYRRGTIDKTLFIKKDKHDIILVQVYVDDIIFGSTKKSWCDEFEALMKSIFQMSSSGRAHLPFMITSQTKEDGPDIMFAVCACSRFQVTPKTSHSSAVKRILGNLDRNPQQRLSSSWQEDYFLVNAKADNMALLLPKAAYVAIANCCGQVFVIQNQMLE
ncbi:ribonuclease H-like domain-containing protein [Tanacetum coccineum]